MASSGGSLNTSDNSHPNFSFSTQFINSSSFTDFLSNDDSTNTLNQQNASFSWGLSDHQTDTTTREIPKFKSFPPPSLPISPLPTSPSSYLAYSPTFSPSIFLDSTALFASSNVLLSPTTGAFSGLPCKEENKNCKDFSFQTQTQTQTQTKTETSSSFPLQSSSNRLPLDESSKRGGWDFSKLINQNEFSNEKIDLKSHLVLKQNLSNDVIPTAQTTSMQTTSFSQSTHIHQSQPIQYVREQGRAEDGYNWRKYGQKQVKGSENPRSYYKCTYPSCPTKKKVERNLEGHITEIVYTGSHNHPKPQSTRRSSSHSIQGSLYVGSAMLNQSNRALENGQMGSVTTPENSSASFGEEKFEQGSPISKSGEDDENEPEAKRWKGENESEAASTSGSRTVQEQIIVVHTTSDIDILNDGYRWRKYGQKVVKGNPNPRSYYKCTSSGCPVRKHVERAAHDQRAVITTYEGKHNHDVPAARGSSNYSMSRPPTLPSNNGSNAAMATRPLSINSGSNQGTNYRNLLLSARLSTTQTQAPYTLQMLPSPGGFGLSGMGNSTASQMMQTQHTSNSFATKEEPMDDSFFDSFLN